MIDSDPSVFDGRNVTTWNFYAEWDRFRSVRLIIDGGETIGLSTSTYSYKLDHGQRCDAARRMADLWNLAIGIPTEDIAQMQLSAKDPAS